MYFSYSEVLKIKKLLDEKFGVYLHFHDACGGQYFSFDSTPDKSIIDYLSKYFSELGGRLNTSDNGLTFSVQKKQP